MNKAHAICRAHAAERMAAKRKILAAISVVAGRMARNIAMLERMCAEGKGGKKHA